MGMSVVEGWHVGYFTAEGKAKDSGEFSGGVERRKRPSTAGTRRREESPVKDPNDASDIEGTKGKVWRWARETAALQTGDLVQKSASPKP